jgi:hypothetical protein
MMGESDEIRRKNPEKSHEAGDFHEIVDDTYVPHEVAGDTVHFLNQRIDSLLKENRSEPVVVVDIGGMYGMTLLELADQHQSEIQDGKLILIVTNIGHTREIIENARIPTNGLGIYNNYRELYQRAGHSVHFVNTDVKGLLQTSIRLPSGVEYKLKPGSIDIIHESWSLSVHSNRSNLMPLN